MNFSMHICIVQNKKDMTIHVNSNYLHNCQTKENSSEDSVLKQTFMETLGNKLTEDKKVRWVDSGTVELNGMSPSELHSFLLKVEAMGKNIKYHKKTVIEID